MSYTTSMLRSKKNGTASISKKKVLHILHKYWGTNEAIRTSLISRSVDGVTILHGYLYV